MAILELQKDIIYGPVNSRRLGRSLGINLMPATVKVCSMNCCYCQYGWTSKVTTDGTEFKTLFPAFGDVQAVLRDAFSGSLAFDYVTFSGNGEPTLHPDFPDIVRFTRELIASTKPFVRLALLSNSTTCANPVVRRSLDGIDLPMMKLDAGNERMFRKMNHGPPPVTLQNIVDGLKALSRCVIQTMFVQGAVNNSTDSEVDSWVARLREVKPSWVQIYSLDRAPANDRLASVPKKRLQEIAGIAESETGLEIEVF